MSATSMSWLDELLPLKADAVQAGICRWTDRIRRVRVFCAISRIVIVAPQDTCAKQEGDPPRKPLPRKKIPADLKSLARGHTALCIKVLAGIVSQEASPPAARVSAAGILLDRGWGRAPQVHSGEDGNGSIRVVIRQIDDA